MSPSFTKDEWFIEVDETEGDRLPDLPILIVTVNDGDEINDFHFQVKINTLLIIRHRHHYTK